jgi:hypothetical protein
MGAILRWGAIVAVCVAVLGASVRAAAQQYVSGPAGCTETDLVTSLHFYQAPHHTQVVALEYRNTSDWTCMFVYFEQNDLDVLQGQGSCRRGKLYIVRSAGARRTTVPVSAVVRLGNCSLYRPRCRTHFSFFTLPF